MSTEHRSYCSEETSKATQREEDLEAVVTKHASKLKAAAARSNILDGQISAPQ